MSLARYETVIIGFLFAIMTLLVFNAKINDLIGNSTHSEIRMLLYAVWVIFALVIGFIFTIGLAKEDTEQQ